jgi:hypothetical protein
MDNAKKAFDVVLDKFFSSYLFLRNNEELQKKKEFPNINKVFLVNLKKYYQLVDKETGEGDERSEEE